jgi:hypothetical protein
LSGLELCEPKQGDLFGDWDTVNAVSFNTGQHEGISLAPATFYVIQIMITDPVALAERLAKEKRKNNTSMIHQFTIQSCPCNPHKNYAKRLS